MLPTPDEMFEALTMFWKETGLSHEQAELIALYQIATGDLYDTGTFKYTEESKRAWA